MHGLSCGSGIMLVWYETNRGSETTVSHGVKVRHCVIEWRSALLVPKALVIHISKASQAWQFGTEQAYPSLS
jgi:hypothetical protein